MSRTTRWRTFRTHLFMGLVSFVLIYPIFWWIGAAFKTNAEMSSATIFPEVWQWNNFTEGWNALPKYSFGTFYRNSFSLISLVIVFAVVACSLTAFGFARLDFPLRNMWFSILILTLMLPSQVVIVPQYIMFNRFGWVDTYLPFHIPHLLAAGNGSAFFVYLLVQFIRGIPRDLDESAKIDGCSWFGIYARIIMPLCRSSLVSVVIFAFLWNWDDFFGQLLYINKIQNYTVGLALKSFIDGESAAPWGQLLAMSLVSVIPAVVLFFSAQKYFVDGISTGALKG
ncbi:carbohydrate ABC transporter permease [Eubacteriales bacterium OttesenSCG-928-A19]|nr:carbohydrate ABC transporter permease [Eubacteriales bacterium OttesenSCG-928-A19]